MTNDPPPTANMQTYEGEPADLYLKLTGYGTKMFRKKAPVIEQVSDIPGLK